MKRLLLIAALLSPVVLHAQAKKDKTPKTFDLLVGGYNSETTKGIMVYRFYTETGRLSYLNQSDAIVNPSYLCLDKDGKYVYAVSERDNGGDAYAYAFEPKTGKLTFVNKQSTKGTASCYVAVDDDRKNIFVANYSSGSLAVLPLNKDGSILPISQFIQDKGSGIDKARQEGPHVHTAYLSPDEKYLLYTDLGTDKISIYRYKDSQDQPLTPAAEPSVSVAPGSGPRHLVFSLDKKHLYAVQEMSATITAFDYDNGKLKQVQSVTMVPDGFKGRVGAADIHISADGRFLYASNRGDANEVVAYSIDPLTGMLTFLDRRLSLGKTPRNFVIDPSGNFLLIANQDSNSIIVYQLDKTTGKFIRLVGSTQTDKPSCLKFAPGQ